MVSNIVSLIAETLAGAPNEKEPTFNKEPSHNNDEVTDFDLIPTPNYAGSFNYISGYTFDGERRFFLVGKKILSPCWMRVVLVMLMKWEDSLWEATEVSLALEYFVHPYSLHQHQLENILNNPSQPPFLILVS